MVVFLATLAGLEKSSAARPGNPPLYIHISGCGILSDNARGEHVESVEEHSDIGLDLKKYVVLPAASSSSRSYDVPFRCPPSNTHLESDIPVCSSLVIMFNNIIAEPFPV